MTTLLLLLAVLFTSALSGILGMGGGFILAGVLALLMPLSAALLIHACAQFTANSHRAFLHRKAINWTITKHYIIGLVLVVLVFFYWQVTIDKSVFYLLLGAIALTSHFLPKNLTLDATIPSHAVASGMLVTALHLFVGVAGPLLDVFYQKSALNRFQIVATKAMTQTLGHSVRIGFYATVYQTHWQELTIAPWVFICVSVVAMSGTFLGSKLLQRVDEIQFRQFSRLLLATLGVLFMIKGAVGLYG